MVLVMVRALLLRHGVAEGIPWWDRAHCPLASAGLSSSSWKASPGGSTPGFRLILITPTPDIRPPNTIKRSLWGLSFRHMTFWGTQIHHSGSNLRRNQVQVPVLQLS